MRRILYFLFCLLIAGPAIAQTTAVSSQITDSDGTTWTLATCTTTLIYKQQSPPVPPYLIGGGNVPLNPTCTVNGSGALSVTVTDVRYIAPIFSPVWQITVCPNVAQQSGPAACGVTQITPSGATYAATLNLPAPRIGGGVGAYAYADIEVNPAYNNFYWNIVSGTCRQWQTSWGQCAQGSAGGATFPSTPGIVYSTSTSASRNAVGTLNGTGDFQLPFTNTCTGTGLSCPLVGNQYQFNLSGGAGSGAVSNGLFGQAGSYAATGTTIGGAPNTFVLNPAWSLNQMNGLFSRFTGSTITSWSITGNVATFQAVNAFNAGDTAFLYNFPTSTFFNNQYTTVLSTGLSNTQFEVNFTHANGSATEAGVATLNVPGQVANSQGVVVIPPGLVDQPSNAYTNTPLAGQEGQVIDTRKGYWWQQASTYGVKCDARTFNVTLTSGSNTVYVGSEFPTGYNAVGLTMVVGQQSGFGQGGTQSDWEPTVTAGTIGTLTLSGNAPFSYSGPVIFGTNNQSSLNAAFKALGSVFPLYVPTGCLMLTDTVRWPGTSIIGQQENYGGFIGFPARDILQQQDGIPITAWSINTSTGLTTFTVPGYAFHNILPGDSINLRNFGTSTFFNNQNVTVASKPAANTFTVANVFGQSTGSSTESGLGYPNTAANANGLRIENLTFDVNNAIDPSFPWNHYSPTGTLTVEPPMYRPLQTGGEPANNPFAPGWGSGAVNGVANITQNNSVICVPTATGARSPAISSTIIFPYQGSGEYVGTVSSTAGSCSTGYTPFTLSTPFPNTSSFTSTQAEWFAFTTPQTLAAALPATITYPYTITMALPFPPVPGYESNVSSHGRIIINGDQFDYMGDNFGGTAGGSPQITLRDGPTTIHGGSGSAIGSVVFPLNPCNAMYNQPWPVYPNLNSSSQTTPVNAVFYPGLCGGNAAVSLPHADASAFLTASSGMSVAFFNNIAINPTQTNSLGNQNNNGSMFMYQAGQNTGYGNTYNNIRGNYIWGGFEQGPASVNEFGVSHQLPASSGQSLSNCTFRTGYPITMIAFNQGNIDRCDTYTTETSPYDGTSVGAATWLYLGGVRNEQTGAGVESVNQLTVKDSNGEPENGNYEETPVGAEVDCDICRYPGTIFEGGFNIFGGAYQVLDGVQIANPAFNYGSNNSFVHAFGLNTSYFQTSYTGLSFYNWGKFSQGECSNGQGGGANTICGPGFVQSYNGHDAEAIMKGEVTHPTENANGGMILPDEFATAGATIYQDATELHWGKHTECSLGGGAQCIYQQFDGFNGYVTIGPHQRITDAANQLVANVKVPSGTMTFSILISAQNPFSLSTCTPNYSLAVGTFTATSTWTPITMPVNFSGYASCALSVQLYAATSTNTLQTGYFNFFQVPGWQLLPVTTYTVNTACPAGTPNGAFLGTSSTGTIYLCEGGLIVGAAGGGGGGGFANPMTTLGDMISGGASGAAARVAGNTSTTPAALTQTGTGSASAAPAWTPGTGTGAPVFANSPSLITPNIGAATASSVTIPGPAVGFAGFGTATFALGSTSQVGTGAVAPTCGTGFNCDNYSGTFYFTTGTGTLTPGTILTVTLPGTRTYIPTCPVTIKGSGSYVGVFAIPVNSSGTVTIPITNEVALLPSTTYTLTYGFCGGT